MVSCLTKSVFKYFDFCSIHMYIKIKVDQGKGGKTDQSKNRRKRKVHMIGISVDGTVSTSEIFIYILSVRESYSTIISLRIK